MARRSDARQATETLQEIESAFDRLAEWATQNPAQVLGVLGSVLLVAAAVGLYGSFSHSRAEKAAAAVARVEADYRKAMGAAPGTLQIVEPANPEIARRTRREFAARYLKVADAHSKTAAAVRARLEAGSLLDAAGDLTGAVSAWQKAVDEAPNGSDLEVLAQIRLAGGLEREGEWKAAAAAWERAGHDAERPGAGLALAQAARCYTEGGDTAHALELFERAEKVASASGTEIPPHIAARLRELRKAAAAPKPSP